MWPSVVHGFDMWEPSTAMAPQLLWQDQVYNSGESWSAFGDGPWLVLLCWWAQFEPVSVDRQRYETNWTGMQIETCHDHVMFLSNFIWSRSATNHVRYTERELSSNQSIGIYWTCSNYAHWRNSRNPCRLNQGKSTEHWGSESFEPPKARQQKRTRCIAAPGGWKGYRGIHWCGQRDGPVQTTPAPPTRVELQHGWSKHGAMVPVPSGSKVWDEGGAVDIRGQHFVILYGWLGSFWYYCNVMITKHPNAIKCWCSRCGWFLSISYHAGLHARLAFCCWVPCWRFGCRFFRNSLQYPSLNIVWTSNHCCFPYHPRDWLYWYLALVAMLVFVVFWTSLFRFFTVDFDKCIFFYTYTESRHAQVLGRLPLSPPNVYPLDLHCR